MTKQRNLILIVLTVLILAFTFVTSTFFHKNKVQNHIGYYPVNEIKDDVMIEKNISSDNIQFPAVGTTVFGTQFLYGTSAPKAKQPKTLNRQPVPKGISVMNPVVICTNANGDVVWEKTYDIDFYQHNGTITKILPQKDGGFLLFLTTSAFSVNNTVYEVDDAIIKCDAMGNVVRQKSMKVAGDFAKFAYQNSIGELFLISEINSPTPPWGYGSNDILLTKLDENLTVLTEQLLGGSNYDEVFNVCFFDGYMVLIGRTKSQDTDFEYTGNYLACYDANLNKKWLKTPMQICGTNEQFDHKLILPYHNDMIVMGFGSIYCIDTNGTLKWKTKFSKADAMGDALFLLSNGNIVVRYSEVANVDGYSFIILNGQGEILNRVKDINGQTVSVFADATGGFTNVTKRQIKQITIGNFDYELVVSKYNDKQSPVFRKTYSQEHTIILLSPSNLLYKTNLK